MRSPSPIDTPRPERRPRVAVLLNPHARSVGRRVVRTLAREVPPGDLYLSRSLGEAERVVETVLDRGYDVVLTGGGDGTFVGFLNLFRAQAQPREAADGGAARALAPRPLPRFGILPLGTGNALALLSGASPRGGGALKALRATRDGQVQRTRSLDMVEVEGRLAPFAGLGYDALVLNNYEAWRRRLAGGPLGGLGEGLPGYLLSFFALSAPDLARRFRMVPVEVVSRSGSAWPIDVTGRALGPPVPPGTVLYRGPAGLVGAATCPHFGFGFRAYPAAGLKPGWMQVRVAHLHLGEGLRHVPAIWRGEYTSPALHDFHAQDVEIRAEALLPFQVGGDAAGRRARLRLTVIPRAVEVLDFRPPLPTAPGDPRPPVPDAGSATQRP